MYQIAVVTKDDAPYFKALDGKVAVCRYSSFKDLPKEIFYRMVYLDLDLLQAEHLDVLESIRSVSLTESRVILGTSDPALIPALNDAHQYSTFVKPFDEEEEKRLADDILEFYEANGLID